MTNQAAEAAAATSRELTGMFDQAFRTFGDSMKVAMKAQQDTVRFWGDAVEKANPMQIVTGDLIPTAQKNADEYLKLMESSFRRNADLLKKVIHTQDGEDGAGMEKRAREWIEASMEVVRDSAQEWASTNLRVAQAWSEVFKKGAEEGVKAAHNVQRKVAASSKTNGK